MFTCVYQHLFGGFPTLVGEVGFPPVHPTGVNHRNVGTCSLNGADYPQRCLIILWTFFWQHCQYLHLNLNSSHHCQLHHPLKSQMWIHGNSFCSASWGLETRHGWGVQWPGDLQQYPEWKSHHQLCAWDSMPWQDKLNVVGNKDLKELSKVHKTNWINERTIVRCMRGSCWNSCSNKNRVVWLSTLLKGSSSNTHQLLV